MPSFLSNLRGLVGSSSSNTNSGGGDLDYYDHGAAGGHGGAPSSGRPSPSRGLSVRHDGSAMTDGHHHRGGSSSSIRRVGGGGALAAGAGRSAGAGAGPGLARSGPSTRRAGDPYDEGGAYQGGGGQYGQQQQPVQPASLSRGRSAPGGGAAPQPVQRSASGGVRSSNQGASAAGGVGGALGGGPAGAPHRRPASHGQGAGAGAGGGGHHHPHHPTAGGGHYHPPGPPLGTPGPSPGPGAPCGGVGGGAAPVPGGGGGVAMATSSPVHCLNPASEVNARLDTQVEVRVYPCNNNASAAGQNPKKKFTQFTVKPEGVIIQGTNRHRSASNDLGAEYALHIGRKLQRYELSDTRACQLLVTTHNKSFWVVPAPEAFSRHSGTCRLLGDRKHPLAPHTLQVGDFLRVGSVGVVVIETHNGVENRVLSEEKIQKIMKDTTSSSGGFLDLGETDGENSDDSSREGGFIAHGDHGDAPVCYMCFDEEDTEENPLITPCKCLGDTRYVHVNCLRKWHTAEADNQICFLSSVDATCSVCKSTFKSDFKLKDGRTMKLFKSSLEPPYVSLLVATKHEMAQRLFNTRFQLSFSTLLKPDGRNATRPLLLGRSSGSDMVLDYRTVSARHASIRFKNGEFIFTDAGSSNGSYLYLRRPVELTASQPVQFRLGRSMISMKIVNKWNRRLLRAVRRTGGSSGSSVADGALGDDHSVGSNEDDVRVSDGQGGASRAVPRRTRESIMRGLPPPGTLSQNTMQHLDLLYALAYPKREKEHPGAGPAGGRKRAGTGSASSSRRPSSNAEAPPASGGGGGGPATAAAAPAPMGRGAPVPAPLVVPAGTGAAPGTAAPRGSGVGASGLLSAAADVGHNEESKVEVEELETVGASPAHDGTLAPVNGEEDEEDVRAASSGDEGEIIGGAASGDSEEEATAILMMAPTAMSEGSR